MANSLLKFRKDCDDKDDNDKKPELTNVYSPTDLQQSMGGSYTTAHSKRQARQARKEAYRKEWHGK